ncbi:hypothetical protein EON77_06225 [bacterium]|nr:MAG: hypothetical protein EON77_06225 [bacterium]
MAASPGALQLRTLQTLDSLGTSAANTVVLAVPVDVMEAVRAIPKMANLLAGEHKSLPETTSVPLAPATPKPVAVEREV